MTYVIIIVDIASAFGFSDFNHLDVLVVLSDRVINNVFAFGLPYFDYLDVLVSALLSNEVIIVVNNVSAFSFPDFDDLGVRFVEEGARLSLDSLDPLAQAAEGTLTNVESRRVRLHQLAEGEDKV